jgi:hypothetical protein
MRFVCSFIGWPRCADLHCIVFQLAQAIGKADLPWRLSLANWMSGAMVVDQRFGDRSECVRSEPAWSEHGGGVFVGHGSSVIADENEDFVQSPEIDLGGGGAQLDGFETKSHLSCVALANASGECGLIHGGGWRLM